MQPKKENGLALYFSFYLAYVLTIWNPDDNTDRYLKEHGLEQYQGKEKLGISVQ